MEAAVWETAYQRGCPVRRAWGVSAAGDILLRPDDTYGAPAARSGEAGSTVTG